MPSVGKPFSPSNSKMAHLLGRLELAVKGSGFAIWEYELNTGKLLWDAKMYSLYGHTSKSFDSSPETWRACIVPEDIEVVDQKFSELLDGKAVEIFEFRIRKHDTGEIRYIEANGAMELDENKNPYRLVGMNRDITDRKNIELAFENERVARISTAKMAALGEMASGIAHEINNPLTIVSISSAKVQKILSEKSEMSEELRTNFERIDSTVKRIAKVVRGLQSFSRNSHGDRPEPISLQSIISDTLEISHERLRNKSIELMLVLPPEPLMILARPSQISQVILNLLNNSYDAIEDLPERWIEIKLIGHQEHHVVEIIDSGVGIPKEIQDKMMQPFFTSKEVGKGTGLGLSISKGIIENHKGSLKYDHESKNTRFILEFPAFKEN
jgi:PAS domain S-box-containing protein